VEHHCNPQCFVFRTTMIFGIVNSRIILVVFLITNIKYTVIFIL
jgi:hypothetical protein